MTLGLVVTYIQRRFSDSPKIVPQNPFLPHVKFKVLSHENEYQRASRKKWTGKLAIILLRKTNLITCVTHNNIHNFVTLTVFIFKYLKKTANFKTNNYKINLVTQNLHKCQYGNTVVAAFFSIWR